MTPSALAAHRLRAHQIVQPASSTPAETVSWLLAVQAQDPAAAKWAVGLRMQDGATERRIDQAIADGSILRTHVMRWTWQLVSPADIRWLLALVAPRLCTSYSRRHHELGLDAATFRRSRAAFGKALRHGAHLTRDQMSAVLARARLPSTGPCLSHLLAHAELDGLLCSGAPSGKTPTYALVDLRAPSARPAMPRSEALAELALRYFQSRGPATIADLAWWAGIALKDAREGVESAKPSLVSEVVGRETFWRSHAAPVASQSASLLPAFDEYLVAYRNRDAVLDPRHAKRVNAGGGLLSPCVVIDGQVIGTWRRALSRETVAIDLDLFAPVTSRVLRRIRQAAQRYGEFLGREVLLAAAKGRPRGR